jgi:hypothetical protein
MERNAHSPDLLQQKTEPEVWAGAGGDYLFPSNSLQINRLRAFGIGPVRDYAMVNGNA